MTRFNKLSSRYFLCSFYVLSAGLVLKKAFHASPPITAYTTFNKVQIVIYNIYDKTVWITFVAQLQLLIIIASHQKSTVHLND